VGHPESSESLVGGICSAAMRTQTTRRSDGAPVTRRVLGVASRSVSLGSWRSLPSRWPPSAAWSRPGEHIPAALRAPSACARFRHKRVGIARPRIGLQDLIW